MIELNKNISPQNKRNISLLDFFSYGFCLKSQSDVIIFHRLHHYTYCISNHIFTSFFKNYITISRFIYLEPKKLIQQYKISKFHTVKTMQQLINSPRTLLSLALESYLVSTKNYPCDNSNFSLNINGSK